MLAESINVIRMNVIVLDVGAFAEPKEKNEIERKERRSSRHTNTSRFTTLNVQIAIQLRVFVESGRRLFLIHHDDSRVVEKDPIDIHCTQTTRITVECHVVRVRLDVVKKLARRTGAVTERRTKRSTKEKEKIHLLSCFDHRRSFRPFAGRLSAVRQRLLQRIRFCAVLQQTREEKSAKKEQKLTPFTSLLITNSLRFADCSSLAEMNATDSLFESENFLVPIFCLQKFLPLSFLPLLFFGLLVSSNC